MGLFFDNYDDCIDKCDQCFVANDYIGAEEYLLKAFDKSHNTDDNGMLYYYLSLTQFELGKENVALSHLEASASLGYPDAVELLYEDDDIDWDEILSNFSKGFEIGWRIMSIIKN